MPKILHISVIYLLLLVVLDINIFVHGEYQEGEPIMGIHIGTSRASVGVWNKDTNNPEIVKDLDSPTSSPIDHILIPRSSTSSSKNNLESIFAQLQRLVELWRGELFQYAVVSVPASQIKNESYKEELHLAAMKSDIEILRFASEPTTALVAYGFLERPDLHEENFSIAVVDFGVTSLEVSLMRLDDEGFIEMDMTRRTDEISGNIVDDLIVEYVVKKAKLQLEQKEELHEVVLGEIRKKCIEAKHELSSSSTLKKVLIEQLPNDSQIVLTRQKLEELTSSMIKRKIPAFLDNVFQEATDNNIENIKKSSFLNSKRENIILSGGSSKLPNFESTIKKYFRTERVIMNQIDPSQVTTIGATWLGAVTNGDYSGRRKKTFQQFGLDHITLSLGVETADGDFHVMIPRLSLIPVKKTFFFCMNSSRQTTALIRVFEGERPIAVQGKNRHIGDVEMDFLPKPGRKNFKEKKQIEITMDVDENGVMHVLATHEARPGLADKRTFHFEQTRKKSFEEIEEILREADENKKQDEEYRGKTEKQKRKCLPPIPEERYRKKKEQQEEARRRSEQDL